MAGGLKFPIQIDSATGRFMESDGADSIRESIYLILMTQKGERAARPDFGSRIMEYPFLDVSTTRLHMMKREIRDVILSQEPRVEEAEVQVRWMQGEAQILIDVEYTIADTKEKKHMEVKV